MDNEGIKSTEWARDERFTTKEDLLRWVMDTRRQIKKKSETDKKHSSAFYHAYDRLLKKFENEISKTVLFKSLEDYWYYSICLFEDGATVTLNHAKHIHTIKSNRTSEAVDQRFPLIYVSEECFTVEEYAKEYGLEPGTVRQWIRRGKIRNARKVGNEWRIPRITDLPGRGGYKSALYMWRERLIDLPEEYCFLNSYSCAIFNRDDTDKTLFHITFAANGVEPKTIDCDAKEREKMEIFMISHPQIRYVGLPEDGMNIEISWKTQEKT